MPKHISFIQKKAIVQYYLSKPMTVDECAKEFQISAPSVIKILDMFQVKRWNKARLFSPNLDEHYFDTIDTPRKAYWLGLLMTDGCVFRNKLCMTLKSEDEYLIKEFLQDLRCNKKIIRTKNRTESSVQITSNLLCEALAKYGIVEQKTGRQQFRCPQYLEAYLHGLLDGDGSISFYSRPGRKSHHKAIRLCGANRDFLESVVSYIGCGRIEKSHEGLETITWSSNDDMMSIINAVNLYQTPCLLRKMHLMNKISDEIREYRDNRVRTAS